MAVECHYDRTLEDIGNVVGLEHVNTRVPDQPLATLFYVSGLGLTRDPYLMTGIGNMWVNVGRSQFHLPTGGAQVLRGHTGLVIAGRAALVARLKAVAKPLEATRFTFQERDAYVEVVCPWGNRLRCFEPSAQFGQMMLGIPYVEFEVARGTADGIARFYRDILGTTARAEADELGRQARIGVGADQQLIFREADRAQPAFDGHHIAIYLADFSGPHRRLLQRRLITEESDQHQYRFEDLVDPDDGKVLFTVEHEVRSMRHPLYARHLVNRNPQQSNRSFAPGHEQQSWALPVRAG
jgi:catechol 2,3-dioxygenase-like lactoylglutathione lyase family enzyme